tara:strand:+ start:71832 stop:72131 length:300 start_codon:yes stop_codon:yes gene_type:complete
MEVGMTSQYQTAFADRVRSLRLSAEKSQEDFAAMANIDRATFGKLERGLINPSLLTLARIAVALEISLAQLMQGVEIDPEEIKATPRSARGPKPMGGRG